MRKNGKHKTLAKELKQTVAWLESFDEIKKIILGISEACRHRYTPGTIRVQSEVLGGLVLNGYSGNGITKIYIQISPPERITDVREMIKKRFPT